MRHDDDLEALECWLPVRLVNGLNRRAHWAESWRRARVQKDAVAAALLVALGRRRFAVPPSRAKCIRFHAYTGNAFDTDGLEAALKHVRDGLIGAGVLHGDAPRDGHTFEYAQTSGTPARSRGVRVRITLRG